MRLSEFMKSPLATVPAQTVSGRHILDCTGTPGTSSMAWNAEKQTHTVTLKISMIKAMSLNL